MKDNVLSRSFDMADIQGPIIKKYKTKRMKNRWK